MENEGAYVLGIRAMAFGDVDMPQPSEGEVLIKMLYCGICGSDIHFYTDGEPEIENLYPFVIGHEGAGEVVQVGAGVNSLQVGDRVALEPGIPCRICEWCVSGRYNLCDQLVFRASSPSSGFMQRYVTHPSELCFALPETVSSLHGALIEPLAVGMSSVQRSGIRLGQSAAILGSGSIGLMTYLSLRAIGVTDIAMVDIYENRLEKARELGVQRAISAAAGDPVEAVRAALGGIGPDVVFETAGSKATAHQAVDMVRSGGAIMITGIIAGDTPIDLKRLAFKEATIMTNFRYHNIYPTAIAALANGLINLDGIVSDVYDIGDAPRALEESLERRAAIIKSVLSFSGPNCSIDPRLAM